MSVSDNIDPSLKEKFKFLQVEGKRLASEGKLNESLWMFEEAKKICPTSKVLQRIEKLKEHIGKFNICAGNQSVPCTSSNVSSEDDKTKISPVQTFVDEKVQVEKNSSTISLVPKSSSEIIQCNGGQELDCSDTFIKAEVLNSNQDSQKSSMKFSASSELSPQSQLNFYKLKEKGKKLAQSGLLADALLSFKKALAICDCPRVTKYIAAIQTALETETLEGPSAEKKVKRASKFAEKSLENNTSSVAANSDVEIEILEGPSAEKKFKHSSGFIQESSENNVSPTLLNETEVIKNFKDEATKYSPESLQNNSHPSTSKGVSESDDEKKQEAKMLYEKARDLAMEGELKEALKALKTAQSIYKTEKAQKRIKKIEELLLNDDGNANEDVMIPVVDDFCLFNDIYKKLYPYQREGVAWMWKLYKMRKGGVLGDDMGLGKTFQIIAFISGMIDAQLVKHVLIIMPVSLLKNWETEFKKWCPCIHVHDFHSGSKKERERNLLRVQRRGHVLLTSYGMVVNNVDTLTRMEGHQFVWDYVILDEGHKIKNPTKTTKAVYEIPSRNRLVLTGTPIQNNLKELWSLYDFVHQGTLLGSLKTFKMMYETPITRSREKDATTGEKLLGSQIAENLKTLIKPYFLRRTKEEVWGQKDKDVDQLEKQIENMQISRLTAKKNDFILWTYMSESQIAIYTDFLHSDAVKNILVSKRSPLVELTTLKKICDHPRLLSQRACMHLGLYGELPTEHLNMEDESAMSSSIDNVTDECLIKESGKLKTVIKLLENLKAEGHRTLVFSLSRKILDMIHRILTNRQWKVLRLDGTIAKTEERERRIQLFQNSNIYPVFLLTTQVGGVGLTLTAADRCIIYDPSWNPATDSQAVDRIYRIGQKRDVQVYRLITCGTVEEKIYRRQIFKDSITRQATGASDPYRYFSKQELRELFSLDDPRYSATQVQLHEMHSSQRDTDEELEKHIAFLHTLDIFGISDHDLMFSKEIQDHTEDNDPRAVSDHVIRQKVATANELIKMESSVVAEGLRLAGSYNRPYQEVIPVTKKGTIKDMYKPPVFPDVVDLTEDACDNRFPPNDQQQASTSEDDYVDPDIQMDYSNINLPYTPKEKTQVEKQYLSPVHMKDDDIIDIADDDDDEADKNKFSTPPKISDVLSTKMSSGSRTQSVMEGVPFNTQYSSTTSKEVEDVIDLIDEEEKNADIIDIKSEKHEFSPIKSPQKTFNNNIFNEISSGGDNILDQAEKFDKYERAMKDEIINDTEKLRESSLTGPYFASKDDEVESQDMNLDATSVQDISGRSDADNEKNNPGGFALDVTKFKGNFQHDLTRLMDENFGDLSFEEAPNLKIKTGRKSCARASTFYISESDASRSNSPTSSTSVSLVNESEEATDSEAEDPSNTASLSFVPDSVPNTPQTLKHTKSQESFHESLSETPSRSFHFQPELLSRKNSVQSDTSILRKQESSIKRITPLKVDRSLTQENPSFVEAMAASLIITPDPSPNKDESIPVQATSTSVSKRASSYDDDDTPIKFRRKKKVMQVCSDSEKSDEENDHRNSCIEDKDVSSNNSVVGHSLEESYLGSERDEQSDLERTFATCKEGPRNNSEEDSSSEDSEEHNYSDESGSVFSEDE